MGLLSVVAELAAIDRRCEARTLYLRTLRSGPIDLDSIVDHVQGITRVDRDGAAYLVISVSGDRHGELWFARFALERGELAQHGEVIASLRTSLPHPGGLQASGDLLAVACEDTTGWARVEIYDLSNLARPTLKHTLVLNNSLREGVSQLTRSKAGWLGFAASGEDYLIFVGGEKFGERQGWFYRYRPQRAQPFDFAGPFDGTVSSTSRHAWGPQSGVAIVGEDAGALMLVCFGAEGDAGLEALRSEMRCFSVVQVVDGPTTLVQQPERQPALWRFSDAELSKLFGANARWGTTAFVDARDRLLTYFTARNPRPDDTGAHMLEISEIRCRP
jgi:hypothetical protein